MKPINFLYFISSFRSVGWKVAALLLGLKFAAATQATVPIYQNFSVLNYIIPGNPPPTIDATNFDNENQFNINFDEFAISGNAQFYEPENTVNYTNNSTGINTGIMTVSSTNFESVGFQFDTLTTNTIPHQMAGTFYNSGTIRCASFLDGNFGNIGQCVVLASNIICPGDIDASADGFLNLSGQNVDLSRSVLTLESPENLGIAFGNNAPFTGTGTFGTDTNTWDPSAELDPPSFVESGIFGISPFFLFLTNAVPYATNNPDAITGNPVFKFVYIQDTSASNVVNNVFFNTGSSTLLGNGEATIQWTGTFLDPATGQTITNYLYLNDDIAGGASTNVGINNGFPDNFTLTESSTPLFSEPPAAPDLPYVNIFPSGTVTNNYAYVSFSGDSTAETNANPSNPSGALTNVPARIQIIGSRELNLSLAQISGQLYTSLTATNQFDGSAGAQIASPYTDINLGVTNGTLTISNLLEARFLNWSGTIQCWSTRWLIVSSNLLGTALVTNDYRVMIVNSQLNPITAAQVQNLKLNATNVVISDTLNVFGALNVSAQSMTLTTNAIGNGASSLEGELNLEDAAATSWSWNGAFPNLLWLTNNGTIIVPNFSDFIGNSHVVTTVSNTPAIQASATLSEETLVTNVTTNVTVTVGAITYTFTNNITSAPPNFIKIGPNFDASLTNLVAAINQGTGKGTVYSLNTFANSTASAGPLAAHAFTVSAASIFPGTAGNGVIPVTTTANPTILAWSGSPLSGGVNGIPGSTNATPTAVPYGAIINNGLLSDQGSTIWVNNFVNGGIITNGVGSFLLNAQTVTLTNGSLTAGGDVSITANTLETSNLMLVAGRSLTLQVTNSLTDDGVTNGNIWTLGSSNGTGGNGLVLPFLPANTATTPASNNLLGTTISMTVPAPNKQVSSTWAGLDYGVSTLGYMTNNVAIGQLSLDSLAPSSDFYFTGTGGPGVSNAIYVDRLVLNDYASYTNGLGTQQIPTLLFNSNLTIYYADAVASGEDVSFQLNKSNGGHLRWVPQYAGHFSSTNVVFLNGTTNTINVGLVEDPNLDSNGNGTPNAFDPNPLFVPSQVNFKFALTNVPPLMGLLTWDSIPGATNTIYYTTNMMMSSWMVVTNFISPATVPPVGGWPITNVVVEPLHGSPHGFYRVGVTPNSADTFGQ